MITLSGHIGNIPAGKSVLVQLNGDASRQTQTDEAGNYEFHVEAGSYEITFELAGHEFVPPSISGTFNSDSILPSVTDPADPTNYWLGLQIPRRQK